MLRPFLSNLWRGFWMVAALSGFYAGVTWSSGSEAGNPGYWWRYLGWTVVVWVGLSAFGTIFDHYNQKLAKWSEHRREERRYRRRR